MPAHALRDDEGREEMPLKDKISLALQKIPLTKEHVQVILLAAFAIAMIFAMHPGTRFW